jgi:uncharacterized protein (TIGR00299 family) protein
MKLLYIDTPMGISGDMFLAALIDLGVSKRLILEEIRKLPLDRSEFSVRTSRVTRHSISAVTFRVHVKETTKHRTFRDIKRLIRGSALSKKVRDLSVSIFKVIAEAEGRVHGISPEKVHFHEVGAMDSIIDIVGAAAALTSLDIGRVIASPVPLGTGWTRTMHGVLPVPAPATLEILKGVPIAPSTAPFELTTPTGAAILKTLANEFGSIGPMTIERTGYGAGKKDFAEAANVLRVISGSSNTRIKSSSEDQSLFVIETNIDDMSGQVAGYLMERLFSAGAIEVYFTPVQMKKTRPGILLTTLSTEGLKDALLDVIFEESTTIGVRAYEVERHCLERKTVRVRTEWGTVRVKVSTRAGRVVNVQPEYEDCRKLAAKKNAPLKKIMAAAASAASVKQG